MSRASKLERQGICAQVQICRDVGIISTPTFTRFPLFLFARWLRAQMSRRCIHRQRDLDRFLALLRYPETDKKVYQPYTVNALVYFKVSLLLPSSLQPEVDPRNSQVDILVKPPIENGTRRERHEIVGRCWA